jgi:hypothetical protein
MCKRKWLTSKSYELFGLRNLGAVKEVAPICALFKAYTTEEACKSIGDRLKGPCYLSREIMIIKLGPRNKEQISDIGKYSFIQEQSNWNQLPAEAQATFPRKSHIFRQRFRKVIVSEK